MEIRNNIDAVSVKRKLTGSLKPEDLPSEIPLKVREAQTGSLIQKIVPDIAKRAQSEMRLEGMSLVEKQPSVESFIAGNFQARTDLQALKDQGKLTPEVQASLDKMAAQPLAAGIDRAEFMANALRNLADPTSISQGDRATCAATTVQIMLAKENPSDYLRILGELASPEGKAKLANGDTIERDANWNNDASRSVTGNLMQPAFMQYATGGSYNNVTDTRLDGAGQGLYADEQAKLTAAATKKDVGVVFGNDDQIMQQLSEATDHADSVSVILQGKDANGKEFSHSVMVEGIKDGKVTYTDPFGSRKTVTAAKFQKMMVSANIPKSLMTAPQKLDAVNHDRGTLALGWLKKIAGKVAGAVKSVVNTVAEGVKKGVHALGKVANFAIGMTTKVAAGLLDAAGLDGAAAAVSRAGDIAKKLVDKGVEFADKAVDKAAELANKITDKQLELFNKGLDRLGDFWNKYGGKIMMVIQIVAFFTPLGPIVSLAVTAIQAIQAADMVLQGIKTGNWKQAAMGVVSVVAAGAGAVQTLGASVVGNAAVAVAATATKVATVASNVVKAADAVKTGNYAGFIVSAASAVSSGANMVGNGASAVADSATAIATNALAYSQQGLAAYKAIKSGDVAAGISSFAALGGYANRDLGGDAQNTETLLATSKYVGAADHAVQAIDSGNYGAALRDIGVLAGGAAESGMISGDTVNNVINVASVVNALHNGQNLQALAGAAKIGANNDLISGEAASNIITSAALVNALEHDQDMQAVNLAAGMAARNGLISGQAANNVADLGKVANALEHGQDLQALAGVAKIGANNDLISGEAASNIISSAALANALEHGQNMQAVNLAAGMAARNGLISGQAANNVADLGKVANALEHGQNLQALAGVAKIGANNDLISGEAASNITSSAALANALEHGQNMQAVNLAAGMAAQNGLIGANAAKAVNAMANRDVKAFKAAAITASTPVTGNLVPEVPDFVLPPL